MVLIAGQALIELRQPLGIDKGFENSTNLEHPLLSAQTTDKSKFRNLVQVGVNLIDQPGLIASRRQKDTYKLNDFIA